MTDKVVHNNIKMLRLKHGGLSQAALAEKIGATRQTVNAIEAAKYAPSLELAFKIADVFGEPLESVFEYR
ncbi:helix-turn-helix transcriptional regulator [Pseudemcibacter aquimaris]|uniref:helix-turn-helix transcriptional regulator n=1 Tax=Pseudemcibacter aquimaris TaxID=2857064 RepID=UPI0020118A8C|nr:helix-turn-helix transcriptional regulator [Pseudemcibacter aquimaris]MCC3861125.1 helix-turn-helix transcriptional regulator [Pseudemcibacter aquimaris]